MNSIQQARRDLINAGFGAPLRAAAAAGREGPPGLGAPEEQCAHLAEIAAYIGESDPHMIGAAWLLEQEGFERSQLSMLQREGPRCPIS